MVTRAIWTVRMAANGARQRRFPFRAPATIERAQRRRLRAIVAHAYRHVPYYRETFDRLGLAPGGFETAADLARLPILEREQLQGDPEYFISRAQPIESYAKLRTGGSSGRPLSIFCDPLALFRSVAHRRRFLYVGEAVMGRSLRPRRRAVIESAESVVDSIERQIGQRSPLPAALRPTLRLSLLDPPRHNLERLEEFRADVIHSYGSYIEALYTHVHESGAVFTPPKLIAYGGDALSDRVRRLLSDEMGIPALTAYGAVEAPNIGFECERHTGIHLNQDLSPLRVIDDHGRDCPVGESGEVVLSNLVNRGTVLLNYRLGDQATMLAASCPCGRSLPLLSYIEGRADDWLRTPSGERRHPQTVRTLFTNEEQVFSYRVVQRSPSDLLVQVVAASGCDRAELEERLVRNFADRLGDAVRVEVEFTDALPRTPRGKVKTVVAA